MECDPGLVSSAILPLGYIPLLDHMVIFMLQRLATGYVQIPLSEAMHSNHPVVRHTRTVGTVPATDLFIPIVHWFADGRL